MFLFFFSLQNLLSSFAAAAVVADTATKKRCSPFGVVCLPPSFRFSALAVASSTTSRSCGLLGEEAIVVMRGEKWRERERDRAQRERESAERERDEKERVNDFFLFSIFQQTFNLHLNPSQPSASPPPSPPPSSPTRAPSGSPSTSARRRQTGSRRLARGR